MNALVMQSGDVLFQSGDIAFNGYESMKADAEVLAKQIENLIVTEDNVKDVKKILAGSNKALKELNSRRIQIKKELMQPYEKFATQIKEIEAIVDSANQVVKSKVQDLEEMEREEKREALKKIYHDKTQMLPYLDYITFDVFFKENYLNKSFTIAKYENELDAFIEKTLKDIEYLQDKGPEYLTEYFNTFNLQTTLMTVESRQEMMARVKDEEDDGIAVGEVEEVAIFEVLGKANIKLIEMLLSENGIKFRRLK